RRAENFNITHYMRSASVVPDSDEYTKLWFVRDPFARLTSFYQKIVIGKIELWCFADDKAQCRLEDKSFEQFILILAELHARGERLQHHLEPQTRHLLGVNFDAIVKIEELESRATELMALIDVDARPQHLNKQQKGRLVRPNAHQLHPKELPAGEPLAYKSFWNEELKNIARSVYLDDCNFYDAL
ncbi:MAG: sulfotransferase family 2 domain-containing protein, partial [Pseudomonadota bacterium]